MPQSENDDAKKLDLLNARLEFVREKEWEYWDTLQENFPTPAEVSLLLGALELLERKADNLTGSIAALLEKTKEREG